MIYALLVVGILYIAVCVLAYACLRCGARADDKLERWAQEHPEVDRRG